MHYLQVYHFSMTKLIIHAKVRQVCTIIHILQTFIYIINVMNLVMRIYVHVVIQFGINFVQHAIGQQLEFFHLHKVNNIGVFQRKTLLSLIGKPIAAAANSSSTNTTTSGPTSISSLPDATSPQSSTTSPSSATTVITESSSTTDSPSLSLCKPVNPCGAHGQCIESPMTSPSSTRRFACICSENWFGRLCDKQIDDRKSTFFSYPSRSFVLFFYQ